MLDEKSVFHLESSLRRIFAMKVTRSTFRELQNTVVSIAQGDRDIINNIFETLFTVSIIFCITKSSPCGSGKV